MTTRQEQSQSTAPHAPLLLSGPTPLVGRQRELALAIAHYEVVKQGLARVILASGEPGIGKTRFLNEVLTCALQDGALVLRGGCTETEGMPPYLLFLEALGQYIRSISPDQLRQYVNPCTQALAGFIPELSALHYSQTTFSSLPPEQSRLRLYEAIATFLEAIALPQVLVLVFDDLHWADPASLDLLCYLLRRQINTRLLILGAYRECEVNQNASLERTLIELNHQRALTVLALHPLTMQEMEALALNVLGGPLCSDVCSLLYTQSEGNPFFAEELLRGWIEMERLMLEKAQWIACGSLQHELPPSIVGALKQRLLRLPQSVIDHLRIAAMIGRTFDLALLATIEEQETEIIENALLEAEQSHLIQSTQPGLFTFCHDNIREFLYSELSISRRRHLHATIEQALEHSNPQTLASHLLPSVPTPQVTNSPLLHPGTRLTQREEQVLKFVAEGQQNQQIAQVLGISEKTVINHLTHIFNKTTCKNRAAATAFAVRHGLA